MVVPPDIDIENSRYDQNTYIGRAKHFFITTNPLNLLASNKKLEEAKRIVQAYRRKERMPESMTVDDLWRAKQLYDSAFHPNTGEKLILIGRMSAQSPVNTMMATGMLMTYQNKRAVIFWQWINQSFNAVVNYSNRSGDAKISNGQLAIAYVCATTGALATALGLRQYLIDAHPLVKRYVPFAAIAAANCVNIPIMRFHEIEEGTDLYSDSGADKKKLGESRIAAITGIVAVIFSRVFMSVPSMGLPPIIMHYMEEKGILKKYPWINLPTQVTIVSLSYLVATPLCCAFFKQWAEMRVSRLEKNVQENLLKTGYKPNDIVVYNKGL